MGIDQDLKLLDFLSIEQVGKILDYHTDNPAMWFGDIAVKLGFINQEDLDSILNSV